MEDNTLTESVDTEPEMEVAETEVNDMSDSEFNKHFESVGVEDGDNTDDSDDTADVSVDNEPDDTLDGRYSTQIDDVDAKLEKPVLLKVDGEVIELTTINELRDMAERGTSVTKKFQKLADDRRALEAQIAEMGETPIVSEDADNNAEIDSVANEILDSDYADAFKADVGSLPREVSELLSNDVEVLNGLNIDYKSGLAQKIMPKVKREMIVKGTDFIETYVSIGKQLRQSFANVESKKQLLNSEPKQNKYVSAPKDVNSMSSKEFDAYFDSL